VISVIVYWCSPRAAKMKIRVSELVSQSKMFEDEGADNLGLALTFMQKLRQEGNTHVCYATENTDMVGKSGVSSVEDGKLPDGTDYTWKKRRK